jgi:predicted TIM-barrel fold metal-dependent hydrolase
VSLIHLPPLACDCHTHIFGDPALYPFDPARQYTPGGASVADLLALGQRIGTGRVVIVQPSPYGADNRCTVDALIAINATVDRARGVAVIDEATTDAALQTMHSAGVRGIRLNLETSGVSDPAFATRLLTWSAQRIWHLGWHLQIYSTLPVLAALAPTIRQLTTPVVVDHFGRAKAKLGVDQPYFDVLLDLVSSGHVWVKLSAAQRISDEPDCADAAPLAKALIAANANRMLWGSDWPHPGAKPGTVRNPAVLEVFNDVDEKRAIERLAQWAGDSATLEKILVTNPAALYDF